MAQIVCMLGGERCTVNMDNVVFFVWIFCLESRYFCEMEVGDFSVDEFIQDRFLVIAASRYFKR